MDNTGTNKQLTIVGTTISGNTSVGIGGGMSVRNSSLLTMTNSTLYGNVSQSSGSAIAFNVGVFNLSNITVAYNIATGGVGGALFQDNGNVTILNSTIRNNTDTTGAAQSAGGYAKNGGSLTMNNTIVSQNYAASGAIDNNIQVSDINLGGNNFLGGDPDLGPLQDNGGPTMTMAPLPGSPVIDAGSNSAATNLPKDQRGARRRIDGDQNGSVIVDIGAVEYSPVPVNMIATGTDVGGAPLVKLFEADGKLFREFYAYSPASFTGVRVAMADVTGDGVDDIITGSGPGGGPHVKVFNGVTNALVFSFFAFAPTFTGGVYVAGGDLNGDGRADIIVGAGSSGGPQVNAYNATNGSLLLSFLAYPGTFKGGVTVAGGDIDADGKDDIITGAGPGGGPHVKVFKGTNGAELRSFFAFPTNFTGGIYVASGDLNLDTIDDIIVSPGTGGAPLVRVYSGLDVALLADFLAYAVNFTGGVRVAARDRNGDGLDDIVTGAGTGGGPHVRSFDQFTIGQIDSFFAYDLNYLGGIYVG